MSRLLFLAAALIPAASIAADPVPAPVESGPKIVITAQRDAEWGSYRHAYKAASSFMVHTSTRPLIQAHMQIRPREPGVRLEGMQVQLAGETVKLDLPVDDIGRVSVPLMKAAYDEDAVLRLNRQKGYYRFSGRYTIKERDDGVYSAAMLREACEQLISAQRASGNWIRMIGQKCVGVTFIYPLADSGEGVVFRGADGKDSAIAAADAEPFDSGKIGVYKVARYRFDAWPAQGAIVAARPPLAIGTLYE